MSPSPELPDLDKLEALALKLGSETWETDDRADGVVFGGDGDSVCVCHANAGAMPEFIYPNDRADFIAAANPAVVLALIAAARSVQPENESVLGQVQYSAPITVTSMTLRKREFLEHKGYSVVGYVMQDGKGDRCAISHGKVEWEPNQRPSQLDGGQEGSESNG